MIRVVRGVFRRQLAGPSLPSFISGVYTVRLLGCVLLKAFSVQFLALSLSISTKIIVSQTLTTLYFFTSHFHQHYFSLFLLQLLTDLSYKVGFDLKKSKETRGEESGRKERRVY